MDDHPPNGPFPDLPQPRRRAGVDEDYR